MSISKRMVAAGLTGHPHPLREYRSRAEWVDHLTRSVPLPAGFSHSACPGWVRTSDPRSFRTMESVLQAVPIAETPDAPSPRGPTRQLTLF